MCGARLSQGQGPSRCSRVSRADARTSAVCTPHGTPARHESDLRNHESRRIAPAATAAATTSLLDRPPYGIALAQVRRATLCAPPDLIDLHSKEERAVSAGGPTSQRLPTAASQCGAACHELHPPAMVAECAGSHFSPAALCKSAARRATASLSQSNLVRVTGSLRRRPCRTVSDMF